MTKLSPLISVARLIGGTVGFVVAVLWVAAQPGSVADAGLGVGTISVAESHPLGAVFFPEPAVAAQASRQSGFGKKPINKRYYWLGASQLYAINQYEKGDHTAPFILFDRLQMEEARLLTLSYPNAYPVEHYLITQYLLENGQPDGLIIGAVYDDMRHGDRVGEPRSMIAQVVDDGQTRMRLLQSAYGRQVLESAEKILGTGKMRRVDSVQLSLTGKGRAPLKYVSLMERSEGAITGVIEDAFGGDSFRGEGRGRLLLLLSDIRRYFESLRARYSRDLSKYRFPILDAQYSANWRAWKGLLQAAEQAGIPVIVYIAPRPTDFFPYDPVKYQKFKNDLRALTAKYSATYINLEDLVPSETFGEVDITFGFRVRDPFHFQSVGHVALAEAIWNAVQEHFAWRHVVK